MEKTIAILMTIAVALLGSYIAKKIKIPAGAMTGAILAVAIFNCLTSYSVLPSYTKPCMQVMGGALLGHRICRRDLKKLSNILKAALVLIIALIALNLAVGFGVEKITDMNLSTALLSTAPGGVSDMALIADDLGADMQTVSIMQLFRLFAVYLIFPPILRLTQKKQNSVISESRNVDKEQPQKKENYDIKNCILTVIIAFAGGYVLEKTGIPAGYMVGSVIACAIFNIGSGKGCIPNNWRFYIQSITGAIIGCTMTQESLKLLGQLALPIVLMVIGMIVSTYVFAAIMARVSELDFQTSLLCLTPGGIQETSLLADDLGCDTMSVVVMHTIRLVVVICIFPTLFSLFSIFS